jgi:hypothetical protein
MSWSVIDGTTGMDLDPGTIAAEPVNRWRPSRGGFTGSPAVVQTKLWTEARSGRGGSVRMESLPKWQPAADRNIPSSGLQASVSIAPVTILLSQLILIALLVLAHLATQFAKYFLGHDHLLGFLRLTAMDAEMTIPAWYSSSALLVNAVAAGAVAATPYVRRIGSRRYWVGLAIIFIYLSLDESAAIHETWGEPFREFRFSWGGFLRNTWVIPGFAAVLAVLAIYARFLWRLPPPTRRLIVLAGIVFVGSAIAVEMISARHVNMFGRQNFTYALWAALEEGGEMMGAAIFLFATLRYFTDACGVRRLTFDNG